MTIIMNSEFRKCGLNLDQMDKIARIKSEESQELVQDSLVNLSNDHRAVILATASLVYEQDPSDLETIFNLCKNVKAFKPALMAATLVLFGAKSVKEASGKSVKNTYYVDPSNFADLGRLSGMFEETDFPEMEKRFNQFFGSVVRTDVGLRIKDRVCDAKGTLTHFSNAYKVAFMTGTVEVEETDLDTTIKNVKAFFKKLDLDKSELETVLNEVLKTRKLKVMAL